MLRTSTIRDLYGGGNPVLMSNYYSGGTYINSVNAPNVPTSGVLRMSQFATLPTNPVFAVTATQIAAAADSTVTAWGNFSNTAPESPTYQQETVNGVTVPYVRFIGSSSSRQYLRWTSTVSMNYGTNGGGTLILFAKYRTPFTQFNRSFMCTGPTGDARTMEWIVADDANIGNRRIVVNPFPITNAGPIAINQSHVPTDTWRLYVWRHTNVGGVIEFFVNGKLIERMTGKASLPDSISNNFYLGAVVGNQGQNMDLYHASMYTRPLTDLELFAVQSSMPAVAA